MQTLLQNQWRSNKIHIFSCAPRIYGGLLLHQNRIIIFYKYFRNFYWSWKLSTFIEYSYAKTLCKTHWLFNSHYKLRGNPGAKVCQILNLNSATLGKARVYFHGMMERKLRLLRSLALFCFQLICKKNKYKWKKPAPHISVSFEQTLNLSS